MYSGIITIHNSRIHKNQDQYIKIDFVNVND